MSETTVKKDKHGQWIRDCLIPSVVEKQQAACPTEKINLKDAVIQKFTNDGGYIITLCYKVIIVLNVDGGERTISFFVKITPEVPKDVYDMIGFEQKFTNETIAYEDILPSLGSPEDFPIFYYSNIEPYSASIAISDFSVHGFSMSKARVNLSLDHILTALKALGKFHGSSFALKFTDRPQFDELTKKLCKSALQNRLHPFHEAALKVGVRRALKYFRKSDDADKVPEVFLQQLEHVLVDDDNLFEFMRSRSFPIEPMAVICHGDFLRNNIAFACDNDGVPTKAMLFDFQTVLYATPMLDVCTFMANSTGHEIREKHFDDIFHTYHDAVIAQFLDKTGLNATNLPDYMSYDAFLREYTIQMPYGFSISAYFVAVLIEPNDLLADGNFERLATDMLTLGGAAVDHEMHAQIIEMYELHKKHNLKLCEEA